MSAENIDPLTELGRRLSAHRQARKLSVRGVADHVGIDESNLRQIEKGGNPTLRTVLRIAAFLEIDLGELFAGLDPSALVDAPEPFSEIDRSQLRKHDLLR